MNSVMGALTKLAQSAAIRSTRAASSAAIQNDMQRFRSPVMSTGNALYARYGGRSTVTVLAGDGIGPEMLKHVTKIFQFANVPVDLEEVPLSSQPTAEEDLDQALTSIRRNGVALKGNIETKFDDPTFVSRNMALRRELDLYANVLHCHSIPTIPSRHKDIDMVVIRENTEGEYSGLEHQTIEGVVESLKVTTAENIERICRFAFDYAIKYGRKKVTAVHKANIQKLGDGLFLQMAGDMAKEYSNIEFESMIVDNASMQLVKRPQQFDIMLMPNLYGNIISNIACGLVGGPGLVSGMNFGEKYAVFETGTRNTGSSLAGKDKANPTSFIRASVDMLRYLGYSVHADIISDSLFRVLVEDRLHTPDIGGNSSTSQMIDALFRHMEQEIKKQVV
ncbi:idhg-1 [Pristionchus pacificus]|uniref:Isocitrate dehydrogenase [NAD] subunit, mitochondrial n=1 Tax=Pristionchus pacificus TaxID=54126 RepID=A0A2A6BXZ8_PRIPA|nr:idhg-1 [Pristionchus pacificus]|eukprot:PDM70882.1 idhg-1 [Pristionchus pacificus]